MSETTTSMANDLTLGEAKRASVATDATCKPARDDTVVTTLQPAAAPSSAPARTSTKAFAATDPHHALAVLAHIDLYAMATHEFALIGASPCCKYSASMLSEVLANQMPEYKSVRASSMMATKAVRYVFDVACELAMSGSLQHAHAYESLIWSSPQAMLEGRHTRGAGIVAYSAAAVELLTVALTTAKARVQKQVDVDDKYTRSMNVTWAVSLV